MGDMKKEERPKKMQKVVKRINVDFETDEEVELLRLMKSSLALEGKKIRDWLMDTLREQFAGHSPQRGKK
jgi:hypothetical protein